MSCGRSLGEIGTFPSTRSKSRADTPTSVSPNRSNIELLCLFLLGMSLYQPLVASFREWLGGSFPCSLLRTRKQLCKVCLFLTFLPGGGSRFGLERMVEALAWPLKQSKNNRLGTGVGCGLVKNTANPRSNEAKPELSKLFEEVGQSCRPPAQVFRAFSFWILNQKRRQDFVPHENPLDCVEAKGSRIQFSCFIQLCSVVLLALGLQKWHTFSKMACIGMH